jgi:hypothetical protein
MMRSGHFLGSWILGSSLKSHTAQFLVSLAWFEKFCDEVLFVTSQGLFAGEFLHLIMVIRTTIQRIFLGLIPIQLTMGMDCLMCHVNICYSIGDFPINLSLPLGNS